MNDSINSTMKMVRIKMYTINCSRSYLINYWMKSKIICYKRNVRSTEYN